MPLSVCSKIISPQYVPEASTPTVTSVTSTTSEYFYELTSIQSHSTYHNPSIFSEPSGVFTSNSGSESVTGYSPTPTTPSQSTQEFVTSNESSNMSTLVTTLSVTLTFVLVTLAVIILLAVYFTARKLKRSKGVAAPTPPGMHLSDYPHASVSSGYPVDSGMSIMHRCMVMMYAIFLTYGKQHNI